MGKTAAWYDEAQTLFVREGLSLAEISRQIGVSATTLSKWKAKGDWERLRKRYLESERHFSLMLQELKYKLGKKALETLHIKTIYALAYLIASTKPYAQRELKKIEKEETDQDKRDLSPEEKQRLLDRILETEYGIKR
ncbi:MAG: hypothetical protein P9M14_05230 [Candidatus Alcyoniella australis]|nr:hypothetical protein [Candidatus Alcyoniella australis]